jgi:hypothetical protein
MVARLFLDNFVYQVNGARFTVVAQGVTRDFFHPPANQRIFNERGLHTVNLPRVTQQVCFFPNFIRIF